jgi:NADP-dependent 3-hydroxy acid dehydrogenase YdfG
MCVINNAGGYRSFVELADAEIDAIVDVNGLSGKVCRAFIPEFRVRKKGLY